MNDLKTKYPEIVISNIDIGAETVSYTDITFPDGTVITVFIKPKTPIEDIYEVLEKQIKNFYLKYNEEQKTKTLIGDEVLDIWEQFSEFRQKEEIIANPTREYHKIWDKLYPTAKQALLMQPELDYKPYEKLLKPIDQKVLYSFNKEAINQVIWEELDNKMQNTICNHNMYFEYKNYWDNLTDINKDMIVRRHDFDYESYWDELSESQRSQVMMNHLDTFDYGKYWIDLTPKQSLFFIDKPLSDDMLPLLMAGLHANKDTVNNYFFEDDWSFSFKLNKTDEEHKEISYKGEKFFAKVVRIKDKDPHVQRLLVEFLKTLDIKKCEIEDFIIPRTEKKSYFSTGEYVLKDDEKFENVIKYDGNYYLIYYNLVYIEDFNVVQREEKLKRLFENE